MNNFEEIKKILNEWYKDGFATWEYLGGIGEDGMFGGSFHSIGDLKKIVNKFYINIDFGSANEDKAIENLNLRLKELNLKCVNNNYGILIIE